MAEEKSIGEENKDKAPLPLRRLLALAKPEWLRLTVATVFLLIGGAAGLAYPRVIGVLIDAALAGGVQSINRAAVAMAVIFAVQAVAVAMRYYLFSVAGERIVTRLREQVYRSIIDQEIGFFDLRKTGELTSRITADATVMQNTVSVNLSMGLRNLVMVVGGIGLLVAHFMVGGIKVRTGAPRGERELHLGEAYAATAQSIPTTLDYVIGQNGVQQVLIQLRVVTRVRHFESVKQRYESCVGGSE